MKRVRKISDRTRAKYKAVIDEFHSNGYNGGRAYRTIYPNSNMNTSYVEFHRILQILEFKEYSKAISDKRWQQYLTDMKARFNLKQLNMPAMR